MACSRRRRRGSCGRPRPRGSAPCARCPRAAWRRRSRPGRRGRRAITSTATPASARSASVARRGVGATAPSTIVACRHVAPVHDERDRDVDERPVERLLRDLLGVRGADVRRRGGHRDAGDELAGLEIDLARDVGLGRDEEARELDLPRALAGDRDPRAEGDERGGDRRRVGGGAQLVPEDRVERVVAVLREARGAALLAARETPRSGSTSSAGAARGCRRAWPSRGAAAWRRGPRHRASDRVRAPQRRIGGEPGERDVRADPRAAVPSTAIASRPAQLAQADEAARRSRGAPSGDRADRRRRRAASRRGGRAPRPPRRRSRAGPIRSCFMAGCPFAVPRARCAASSAARGCARRSRCRPRWRPPRRWRRWPARRCRARRCW